MSGGSGFTRALTAHDHGSPPENGANALLPPAVSARPADSGQVRRGAVPGAAVPLRGGDPRMTFAEQVPGLTRRFARRTERLRSTLVPVGPALAGRPGARMTDAYEVPVSRNTLLRLITPLPDPATAVPPRGRRASPNTSNATSTPSPQASHAAELRAVEAHAHRIKALKLRMSGRSAFRLLRERVLRGPAPASQGRLPGPRRGGRCGRDPGPAVDPRCEHAARLEVFFGQRQ